MGLIIGAYGGSTIVGKVGGKVFQRGSFGNVVRNLALPVAPNTQRQVEVKSIVARLSWNWTNVLTVAMRKTWIDYGLGTPVTGKMGTQVTLSGRSWFLKANMISMLQANTYDTIAPVTPGTADPVVPTFTSSLANGLRLVSLATPMPVGSYLEMLISIPVNFSRLFFKGPFVSRVIIDEGNPQPNVLKAPGTVALTQKYYIQYRIRLADGKVSPALIASVETG
jgi:hypothetical protein